MKETEFIVHRSNFTMDQYYNVTVDALANNVTSLKCQLLFKQSEQKIEGNLPTQPPTNIEIGLEIQHL
jgi:hypothetical protein